MKKMDKMIFNGLNSSEYLKILKKIIADQNKYKKLTSGERIGTVFVLVNHWR